MVQKWRKGNERKNPGPSWKEIEGGGKSDIRWEVARQNERWKIGEGSCRRYEYECVYGYG